MSQVNCSSCGAANSTELVYCSGCGALLDHAPSSSSPTASVARRRHQRIESDLPSPPAFLTRLKGVFFYAVWVALGVIIVLSLMRPREITPMEKPFPAPRALLDQIMTSARYTPAGITQLLANSLLSQQGAVTYESPVRLIPMPVWDENRVDLYHGGVVLHSTVSLMGLSVRLSETFRLQGGPGAWGLSPVAGTIGKLDLVETALPMLTALMRPPVAAFDSQLRIIASSKSLVIRPGEADFSAR